MPGRNGETAVSNADTLAFWKSLFPDAPRKLPPSKSDGIVTLTAGCSRSDAWVQTLRATLKVPLADAKGITFIEKFSQVLSRDYESSAEHVVMVSEMSQRILDQLPNNVPTAKIIKVTARSPLEQNHHPGGCRTKPVKELIPEGVSSHSRRFRGWQRVRSAVERVEWQAQTSAQKRRPHHRQAPPEFT